MIYLALQPTYTLFLENITNIKDCYGTAKRQIQEVEGQRTGRMKVINVVLLKLGVTVDYKNQFVFVRV